MQFIVLCHCDNPTPDVEGKGGGDIVGPSQGEGGPLQEIVKSFPPLLQVGEVG